MLQAAGLQNKLPTIDSSKVGPHRHYIFGHDIAVLG
jgi:hypothetical protein